jgi:hypothetical protein
MRHRSIAALCTLLAWAPVASAQDELGEDYADEGFADEGYGDETSGLEVAPPARQQGTRVRTSEGAQAPGQVHTVVRGDTLWDLSQSYLGSPWYWPKVWSYNPEIANPHWIYPGNRVRFFSGGEEVPSRVEVASAPEEFADEVDAPQYLDEPRSNVVQVSGKVGYTPRNAGILRLEGFVTGRELEDSGRIVGSFAESLMLSAPSTVYIQFRNASAARVGEEYVVFRTMKKVKHPINGQDLGHLTHFLGKVRVVSHSEGIVTAQITETWNEINRGDLIGPMSEDLRMAVTSRPNERELRGFVVEMMVPFLTLVGEHQLVLVDKGSAEGVQVGNAFTVVRQQDGAVGIMNPHDGSDRKWPVEPIATCVVVDTKDKTSACLLTRSIREVVRGDRVVMTPQGTGAVSIR